MSYSYERVERRSRSGPSYGASGRRSTLGYWVPLVMTLTAASIGVAAWIWSERRDDEEESEDERKNNNRPPTGYPPSGGGPPPGPGPSGYSGPSGYPGPGGPGQGPPTQGPVGPDGQAPIPQGAAAYYADSSRSVGGPGDDSISGRVTGALKRTPSPQQSYDWASKTVAAGVAAAGAMVGGALKTVREGSQEDYEDHERWSEEADSRDGKGRRGLKRRGTADEYFSAPAEMPKGVALKSQNRKTVVVVVSAVESGSEGGEVDHHAVSAFILYVGDGC